MAFCLDSPPSDHLRDLQTRYDFDALEVCAWLVCAVWTGGGWSSVDTRGVRGLHVSLSARKAWRPHVIADARQVSIALILAIMVVRMRKLAAKGLGPLGPSVELAGLRLPAPNARIPWHLPTLF